MKTLVLACIDGSSYTPAVCDAAVWASQRLDAPLKFFHALQRKQETAVTDLSGSIGFDARESLLEELVSLDEKRNKLAMERGRQLLAIAKDRALTAGSPEVDGCQRHGGLVETLTELQEGIRLLVLGQRGEAASIASEHLGSHLERVVRTMQRPILVTPAEFKTPKKVMLAFDGSATTRKGVDMVAGSPLLRGLPCHLVMAGSDTAEKRGKLEQARQTLENAGIEAPTAILPGESESVLRQYQQENDIDMIIMGAYGHSRIRQFLIGSTTTAMLRQSVVPVLLLR
ncbi:universal stress protein UspA [Syntrophotalea acetylenivorans]|uniref:Universal stress protein UspA n=1 Tax=Syntrophotalea acetylenivorans TaxID=1842532 RepID=A0A1L3GLG6_9BACT|nr:universal stress protein [Syntrophotalea acetylenivorans]APG26740.1 universal stress protein UspA [Syntrophotalea acetylenivorans]